MTQVSRDPHREVSEENDRLERIINDDPVDLVVSGDFELCIPLPRIPDNHRVCDPIPSKEDMSKAFIRNAGKNFGPGLFTKIVTREVTESQAKKIKAHPCVRRSYVGSLFHYAARGFGK